MRFLVWLFALALLGCSAPTPRAADDGAIAAAQAIFDRMAGLHIQGLPDEAQLAALAPHLSVELHGALASARRWQQAEIASMQAQGSEDKPPFIEGDLFGSLFEGAQSTRALSSEVRGNALVVILQRAYGEAPDRVEWQDRAVLVQEAGGWRLADVEYGGEWAFQAGTGNLLRTLAARD